MCTVLIYIYTKATNTFASYYTVRMCVFIYNIGREQLYIFIYTFPIVAEGNVYTKVRVSIPSDNLFIFYKQTASINLFRVFVHRYILLYTLHLHTNSSLFTWEVLSNYHFHISNHVQYLPGPRKVYFN